MAASNGRKTSSSNRKSTRSTAVRASARKRKSQIAQDSAMFHEIGLIALFAAMVFFFCCNFGIVGPVGDAVSGVLFGVFGFCAYMLPVLLFLAVAFWFANTGAPGAVRKIAAGTVLFLMTGIVCDLIAKDAAGMEEYSIAKLYEACGKAKGGGGILGGSLSFFLQKNLETIGTVLVVLLCTVVSLILLTEKSLIGSMKRGGSRVRELSREDAERRREMAEARRLEKEEQAERRRERDEARRAEQEEAQQRRREEAGEQRERKARERRLRAEEKENEKILGTDRRRGGASLDNLRIRPGRRNDMHEIILSEEELGMDPLLNEDGAGGYQASDAGGAAQGIGNSDSGTMEKRASMEKRTSMEKELSKEEKAEAQKGRSGKKDAQTKNMEEGLSIEGGSSMEGSPSAEEAQQPYIRIHKAEPDLSLESTPGPDPLSGRKQEETSPETAYAARLRAMQKTRGTRQEENAGWGGAESAQGQYREESVGQVSEAMDDTSRFLTAGDTSAPNYENEAVQAREAGFGSGGVQAREAGSEAGVGYSQETGSGAGVGYSQGTGSGIGAEYSPDAWGKAEAEYSAEGSHGRIEARVSSEGNVRPESGYRAEGGIGRAEAGIASEDNIRPENGYVDGRTEAGKASADGFRPQTGPIPTGGYEEWAGQSPESGGGAGRQPLQNGNNARIQPEAVAPKKYMRPSLSLLQKSAPVSGDSERELRETAMHLQQTLGTFGVKVTITDISQGPSVTRYELQPEQGVKVSKIVGLADDIKLNLAAMDIRIEAPIPGKAAIGIEVPNKETMPVGLRDLLETKEFQDFQSNLAFAVGKDIAGQVVVSDIAKMPHMLIAGATGSGKSVCINTLIMSILYKAHPDDVKMIMIDPKVVELSIYNGIPHLLIPVVTDPKKASGALHWGVSEMDDRYRKFAEFGARNLKEYNRKVEARQKKGEEGAPKKLPQIVIIVDELADLMMVCPGEVEASICRLAQLARACGIHLVIATQRPSVDVITGLIKANMPSRVAFSVSSGVDSRTILDMVGAEKLLGKGDMLFYPQGYPKPARVQGAFVSDQEVSDVVDFLKNQSLGNTYEMEIEEKIASIGSGGSSGDGEKASGGSNVDELFEKAGRLIIDKDKASIGMLQRALQIGFNRAARIMDQLCQYGVVGEEEGTKPRKILMSPEQFEQLLEEVA